MIRSHLPRRLAAGAATVVVVVAMVAGTSACDGAGPTSTALPDPVAASGGGAGRPGTPADPAAARALSAAAALVAGRPSYLHAGPDDGFVQLPVISALGWHYVPYERTYRGLPVVGGDFVVVVDPAGRVSSTSVAQKDTIEGVGTVPTLTLAAAQKVAAGLLRSVSNLEPGRLVVYALGTPRLAWESTVNGTGTGGVSRLTVYVDALNGELLDSHELVANDQGIGAYNGPNPLSIATSSHEVPKLGHPPTPQYGYINSLEDPQTNRLSCGSWPTRTVFSGSDQVWGNGNQADLETQCVDALYAAQTQVKMLSAWLGRNGVDGYGGAVPIYVGLQEENAYYGVDPQQNLREIRLGHNLTTGRPYTTLDIVGHEMGHGIDDHTPGGLSQKGTLEFIADAFGTATEWYANEPPPFDTPDWAIGESTLYQVDNSTPPRLEAIRWMDFPPGPWFDRCYYSEVDNQEPHVASGVGDRWFYLLAEGETTTPTNGGWHPTCNGTTMTGIGIEKALQILYHAMLMKTSNSSYPAYRTWTVTAANNLFHDNCVTVQKVKAAWDGVSVPAQPDEPACIGRPLETPPIGNITGDG